MPPSLRPAGTRLRLGRGWFIGLMFVERKPNVGILEGIPFNGVVSVIFLGIPRDRSGIVGADVFFNDDWASADLCNNSARKALLFGLRFNVKCLVGDDCWPTYNNKKKRKQKTHQNKHFNSTMDDGHCVCWNIRIYLPPILGHSYSNIDTPMATCPDHCALRPSCADHWPYPWIWAACPHSQISRYLRSYWLEKFSCSPPAWIPTARCPGRPPRSPPPAQFSTTKKGRRNRLLVYHCQNLYKKKWI